MTVLDLLALLFCLTHTSSDGHTGSLWVSGLFDHHSVGGEWQANQGFVKFAGTSHQSFHFLIGFGQILSLLGLQEVVLRYYLQAGGSVALQIPKQPSLSSQAFY